MKLIEEKAEVPKSKIWSLQDHFYLEKGVGAWEENLVPSQTTTNAYIADSYAAVIAAFIRDCKDADGPVTVIEAGGGNGILASRILHFLGRRLKALGLEDSKYEYYLTDGAASNLEHWKKIPRFQHLKKQGILKLGTLWVAEKLEIRSEEGMVTEADLGNRPVVLITNYLHGTIPCDLYRVKDGKLYRELVSLYEKDEDSILESDGTGVFQRIIPEFEAVLVEKADTGHPLADELLDGYKSLPGNRSIPVPLTSLRFLEIFLKRKAPFLSLLGDLGLMSPAEFRSFPPFLLEEYFAYYTNIHMLRTLVERSGGTAVMQDCHDRMLVCGAFIRCEGELAETLREAKIRFQEYPPFDFYSIQTLVENTDRFLHWRDVGAWLRTSRYDPDLAMKFIPQIEEELLGDSWDELRGLAEALYESVYTSFPALEEDHDYDLRVIQLLLRLNRSGDALELVRYGLEQLAGTEERVADRHYFGCLACVKLDRLDEAESFLDACLKVLPGHDRGLRLKAKFEEERAAAS